MSVLFDGHMHHGTAHRPGAQTFMNWNPDSAVYLL